MKAQAWLPALRDLPVAVPGRASAEASLEADARAAATDATPMPPLDDFSGVRTHADPASARAADALGARAFTIGNDMFFGPGQFAPQTAEGGALLRHELTHVAQQQQQGQPALQFQPKKEGQKAGIGAMPPAEDFIKDEGDWGAEDEHVLFEQDDATLDAGDESTIKAWAAQSKEAVYVHVHGYASQEGVAEYNLNLSAHRGAQVKHRLESLLPAGSKVFIFAHGQSRHFGPAESNRRAGLSLIGPVDSGFKLKLGQGHTFGQPPPLVSGTPGVIVTQGPGLGFGQPGTGLPGTGPIKPGDPAPSPTPWLVGPPPLTTPRHLMDNATLLGPSAFHGVPPWTTGNIVDQWDSAYWKYHAMGIPDTLKLGPIDFGAGALANKEVTNSIQAYHERNDPTVIEKSNQDVGAHIITSPNLLDLIPKKKDKGK